MVEIIFESNEVNSNSAFKMELNVRIQINKKGYLRVETETKSVQAKHLAMTNPIWITPQE